MKKQPKETRTIEVSLKNWKRISQLKIKQGLRSIDQTISYMFKAITGGIIK